MTIFVPLVLFALSASLQVHDVTSWSFLPVHEPVRPKISKELVITTRFLCQADTPLTKCQVSMFSKYESVALIDLSQGLDSGVIRRSSLDGGGLLFNVRYNGTGLENGQCGATFGDITGRWTHYGCRGADEKGEWHTMDFAVTGPMEGRLPASVTPREAVVMPGNNVSILLKTDAELYQCFMSCGATVAKDVKQYYSYVNGTRRTSLGKHYRLYGEGPANGECGTTVINVSEEHNGPMRHLGLARDYAIALRFANVIVAAPPTETNFNVDNLKYSVGDTLNATCSSLLSRPVANLTWTLDDRIIRQDGIDDEFQGDVWSWPWDRKNITQKMSIQLEEEHFGKKLECVVQHLALTNQQSDFNYLITKV